MKTWVGIGFWVLSTHNLFSIPFHHVFKDDHWHHGYSDNASAGIKDVHDLGVLIKEIK